MEMYASKVVVVDDEMQIGLRALQQRINRAIDELLERNARRRGYRRALREHARSRRVFATQTQTDEGRAVR